MIETESTWDQLPEDLKTSALIRELILIEVQKVDSVFVAKYIEAKGSAKDSAYGMRLDLALFQKIGELSNLGKISPTETLKEKALKLTRFGSEDLRRVLTEYSQEIKK